MRTRASAQAVTTPAPQCCTGSICGAMAALHGAAPTPVPPHASMCQPCTNSEHVHAIVRASAHEVACEYGMHDAACEMVWSALGISRSRADNCTVRSGIGGAASTDVRPHVLPTTYTITRAGSTVSKLKPSDLKTHVCSLAAWQDGRRSGSRPRYCSTRPA